MNTGRPAQVYIVPVWADHMTGRYYIDQKRLMLKLINEERIRVGLRPVIMAENAAAQLHAEAASKGCFSSYWGLDGLKPYMTYSLSGD